MGNVVRVWFNHWFSTAYHIINLLKDDDNTDFIIIGSNENPDAVIKLVCNEWFVEPKFANEEEYVNFCIDFCKRNLVDVFVPRRGMQAIARELDLFDAIGVKVLVERDYQKLCILNDKERTYCLFNNFSIGSVPPRYVVNNANDFCMAYEAIAASFERVCFKFTRDEGAISFRVVDNSLNGYNGLYKQPGMKVTYKDIVTALNEKEKFPDMMVMPYLAGHEASIDCLRTSSGLIIIPRIKIGRRAEEIRYDDELIQLCKSFYDRIDIYGPCNIQFRYHEKVPYLLEVNTRMSGGIQLSCLGSGVNIPNIAVNQLLGKEKPWSINTVAAKVAYVETPVILSEV
jgi:hypothetical protein